MRYSASVAHFNSGTNNLTPGPSPTPLRVCAPAGAAGRGARLIRDILPRFGAKYPQTPWQFPLPRGIRRLN